MSISKSIIGTSGYKSITLQNTDIYSNNHHKQSNKQIQITKKIVQVNQTSLNHLLRDIVYEWDGCKVPTSFEL